MKIIVDSQNFDLGDNPLAFGGEGELYTITSDAIAKIYYPEIKSMPTWTARRQKVLALCNSYVSFSQRHRENAIAFPQFPAYETSLSFDSLVGFSMLQYDFPKISRLGFEINEGRFQEADGIAFSDKEAIAFVYDLFTLLDQLHQSRIVLGDINPDNILPAYHRASASLRRR